MLFCFQMDKEKLRDDDILKLKKEADRFSYTDMDAYEPVTKESRMEQVHSRKMSEFDGTEQVITDRLRGIIFSAMTETPCIVPSNAYLWQKDQYRWLSHLPYIYFL